MDARERLNKSLDVIGDGQFVSGESAAAWSTLAGALALQSIAASLIAISEHLAPSDPIRHTPGQTGTGAPRAKQADADQTQFGSWRESETPT